MMSCGDEWDAKLLHWADTNSGTHNPAGLARMADILEAELAALPGVLQRIRLPRCAEMGGAEFQPGDVLSFRFRTEAPVKVLLSGHMDTVYGHESPFQQARHLADGRIHGPGVADMKGGLLIMIEAVRRLLLSGAVPQLGGEILITADEELGSPGSHELILQAARRNHYGLVFECALPGGELVVERKGTGTFRIAASGRAAHTGRDFAAGRNALAAIAEIGIACHRLNRDEPDALINLGRMHGGGAVNIVPDFAEAYINVRASHPATIERVNRAIAAILDAARAQHKDIGLQLEGGFSRPPKQESATEARLHQLWNAAESGLGIAVSGKGSSGGSSDGNLLAEAGLPHLDGVGILGGRIHSPDEFAWPHSIEPRISTVLAFFSQLAGCDRLGHPSPA